MPQPLPARAPAGAACALLALLALLALGAALPAPPPGSPPLELKVERVVMDVDAGTDDAMALLLLLSAERLSNASSNSAIKVEAVTCVGGNTNLSNVIRNVFRLLDAAQRLDVPVYAGAAESLVLTPKSDNYFGADGFGDIEDDRSQHEGLLQKEHAVNVLLAKAFDSPGEVTLLALGPLTNVALAERMRKGFVCQLRHLIWLGGSVEGVGNVRPGVEFNAYMDPEALHVVLDAAGDCGRPLLLVPWEAVFLRLNITTGWRREVLGALPSAGVRLLNAAERRFLARPADGQWVSADPPVAALALSPALVTRLSPPLHVGVALGAGGGRASLQVDYGHVARRPPNARIVQEVNAEGLRQLLLRTLA